MIAMRFYKHLATSSSQRGKECANARLPEGVQVSLRVFHEQQAVSLQGQAANDDRKSI